MRKIKKKSLINGPLYRARWARMLAKAIDLTLVCIGMTFYYPMGLLLGITYLALSDSLYDGQSIGKRLMGFSVVSLIDGSCCSPKQSLVRNLPMIVPFIFLIFPFWGWYLAAFFAFPLVLLEVYFLFRGDTSHRLGDILADTTVIANDGTRLDLRKKKQAWPGQSVLTQR